MNGRALPVAVVLLLAAPTLFGQALRPDHKTATWYKAGNRLFNLAHPTEKTDSLALQYFSRVIDALEKQPQQDDTLLFQSYLKKGNLLDVKTRFSAAKEYYLDAIALCRNTGAVPDSMRFKVYVYAASCYYQLNNFDSANILLLKAETFTSRYPRMPEIERMYNTLGALYFENGNYAQSRNYFTRALETILKSPDADPETVIGFKTNIASSLFKLGLYKQALAIYQSLLKHNDVPNSVYFSLGKVQSAMGNYQTAMAAFRKVNAVQIPGVYNEMAFAQLQLSHPDSADYFLDKFRLMARRNEINNIDKGINQYYRAETFLRKNNYKAALPPLQAAITCFSGNFNDSSIFNNPAAFLGCLSPYNLFNALNKKAAALARLYDIAKKETYLIAALETYKSAITLVNYIEKGYDTDDSKLFLKNKSHDIYQQATTVALRLYALHSSTEDYLCQAYLLSEKNKASVITAGLKEKEIKGLSDRDNKLLQEERNIKYNIAKLNISIDQLKKSALVKPLVSRKMNYETELSLVQKKLEQNNFYFALKYDDASPRIEHIQQTLHHQQALISFQAAGDVLHVFVLSATGIQHRAIDSFPLLRQRLRDWLNMLRNTEPGKSFNAAKTGQALYRQLIKPIQDMATGKTAWIIIPDDLLCYLPFESLPAGPEAKSLVETTEISYQFSAGFFVNDSKQNNNETPNHILAFAPFAIRTSSFKQLPASREEIAGLPGQQYIDTAATKEKFLAAIKGHSIIHLATHAVSDINNSAASYIAFYPATKRADQDNLYLEELYTINMEDARLVIISACETGNGELVNNEGVISIARSFAYAGCSSTINSLWKADDKATAFILQHFHVYLQQGYTKSKSLQLAKIDFINSDAVYKGPAYWAHLVLVGNNEPLYNDGRYYNMLITAALLLTLVIFLLLLKKRKKSRRFPQLLDSNITQFHGYVDF